MTYVSSEIRKLVNEEALAEALAFEALAERRRMLDAENDRILEEIAAEEEELRIVNEKFRGDWSAYKAYKDFLAEEAAWNAGYYCPVEGWFPSEEACHEQLMSEDEEFFARRRAEIEQANNGT